MSTSNLWILCIFNLMKQIETSNSNGLICCQDAEILCQVKEVVQQSLSCHSTKMLKAIKHNDHCALTMKAFLWRFTKWHEILVELRNYTKPEKQIMTTLSKFTWIHMDSSLSRLENATKPFHRALKGSILRTCHELRRNLLPQMSQAFDVGMVEILGFTEETWTGNEEIMKKNELPRHSTSSQSDDILILLKETMMNNRCSTKQTLKVRVTSKKSHKLIMEVCNNTWLFDKEGDAMRCNAMHSAPLSICSGSSPPLVFCHSQAHPAGARICFPWYRLQISTVDLSVLSVDVQMSKINHCMLHSYTKFGFVSLLFPLGDLVWAFC